MVEVQAAWTTSVISISIAARPKGETAYHRTDITDGNLAVVVYQLSNVSEIGKDLLGKLTDASGLTLLAALDWKKYEDDRKKFLEAIQNDVQAAGDVTLDVDLVAFAAFVDKVGTLELLFVVQLNRWEQAGYKNRVGEFVVDIVKALSSHMTRLFKNDETARTALQVRRVVWSSESKSRGAS